MRGSRIPRSRSRASTSATTIRTAGSRAGVCHAGTTSTRWRAAHGKAPAGRAADRRRLLQVHLLLGRHRAPRRHDRRNRAAGRRGGARLRLSGRRRARSGCCSTREGRPRADARCRLPLQLRRYRSVEAAGEGRHPGHQPDQPLRPQRKGMARVDAGMSLSKAPSRWPSPSSPGPIAPTIVGSKEKVRDADTG